jgi:hypothetical protein
MEVGLPALHQRGRDAPMTSQQIPHFRFPRKSVARRPWITPEQAKYMEWRESIEADGWLTPNTYGREFAPITNISAVYLFNLLDIEDDWKSDVVYVGMSTKLLQRVTGHPVLAEIAKANLYVQKWFKPTPRENLRDVERLYIQKFNPPWNIVGKARRLQ